MIMEESNEMTPTLKRAKYVQVKDLEAGSKGHNLVVKVVTLGDIKEKTWRNGYVSSIREAVVGDTTGCVKLSIKDDQIDRVKVDEAIVIRNCNVNVVKGFIVVNVSKWGKISTYPDGLESTPQAPTEVNMEKDISAVEYEVMTVDEEKDE